MSTRSEPFSAISMRWAFFALEAVLVVVTLAALTNNLLDADWGLSWSTFFVGMIGSCWALVIYQLVSAHVCGRNTDS
ncbi:hypothetical protein [Novosphingobium sp. ST904]|uniref:hypothetical protein n=1 Tax=Novosphingobium sp. ST904 TaxID=1684385 RepID=UPI000AEC8D01|nr:hypothetical protein [Novosphingobium sp. ST904]TCM40644.1 hypothetical protein EDF59_104118 [Novosphingobium sp. ST904]